MSRAKKNWIQNAIKHKGGLRDHLGIKQGHNIPLNKLEKATHSKTPLIKKEAILAETLKNFRKK